MDKKKVKNKESDKVRKSNYIKEIIVKCLIICGFIFLVSGITCGFIFLKNEVLSLSLGLGLFGIGCLCALCIVIIGSTFKEEVNNKDFKIKYYDCSIQDNLEDRLSFLYDGVTHSSNNENNFFSIYRKENEVVVIAVMYVGELFNEDEFITYMNEIPELVDRTLCHTLIVIFIENEKSQYLKEIMYTPEYYQLRDTKVFSVYDSSAKRLKVNKTNSGTGDRAYNDAKKDLNKIFNFKTKK